MASAGSYFVGLNSQPNLFAQIYQQKDAAAAAREAKNLEEQNKKYEKDADKFRIDYSKIHPYHAKEAKLAVAKFMSEADRLKKELPHTYSNTEEYNNLFFETTSKLEDLTNSSKNIYGDFQRRADKPTDFETRPEILEAINKNDHATVQKLLGKDYFDAGDITQPRFKIEEHAELLNKGLERPKVYNEAQKRNVGGGSNDYIIPFKEAYDPAQFNQLTEVTYAADPVAQQKFKTIDEYRATLKPLIELKSGEEVKSLMSIPAGSGTGAAIQSSLSNQGQGHSMDFGIKGAKGQIDYRTKSPLKMSIVPTNTVISASENTFNKQNGVRISGGGQIGATVGEIALVPVYKKTGNKAIDDLFAGRVASEEDLGKADIEYKVIYTGEAEEQVGTRKVKSPIYGDIEQVETALFSKESPITDKEAFAKTLEDMKKEATRLNKELSAKKPASGASKKTVVKKFQNKTTNQTKFVYSDGSEEIIDGLQ